MCMGGGGQNPISVQATEIPDWLKDATQKNITMADAIAGTPYANYENADPTKRFAAQNALQTRRTDYLKSMYLLKIKGYDIDNQNNTISDSSFLMHQMELREESDEIMSKKNETLKQDFFIKLNVLKKKLQNDFKIKYESGLFEEASDSIKKIKFYISIENDLKRNG